MPASSHVTIPRIIHQSWKTQDIPEDIFPAAWRESWREVYPEWEHRFWTDADNDALVAADYPQFLRFYRGLSPGIKKADFARFLSMHRFGGIYADLDFVALRPLGPLLGGISMLFGSLSKDNAYYQIPNAFMASAPGDPFWIAAASDAMNAPPEERSVEMHAGPFRLQWAFDKYRPRGARVLGDGMIYPIDWIHFTGWSGVGDPKFRGVVEQAGRLALPEMRKRFPRSYCVTFWAASWQG